MKALRELILWMRKNGIAWSVLEVGGVRIEGGDTKLVDQAPPKADQPEPRAGIYHRYGADLLREASESGGMTSVVEQED